MIPYLTRRAVHSAFALLGLLIAVFFLARLTGDPTDLFLPLDASLEDRVEFARKHGYDRPATEQFVHFVGDVMEGNLGFSLRKQRPAMDLVLEAYPTTLKLAGVTLLIAISLAVFVGALAAYRPGGVFDRMGSTFALVGASADPEEEGQALEITEGVDGVERVTQLLRFHVGPDVAILSMKIALRKAMLVEDVEDTINEIERRIRAEMPTMRKIFIEVDAHGDGRGLERARAAWKKRKAEGSASGDAAAAQ